jgi:hypothetical protein
MTEWPGMWPAKTILDKHLESRFALRTQCIALVRRIAVIGPIRFGGSIRKQLKRRVLEDSGRIASGTRTALGWIP